MLNTDNLNIESQSALPTPAEVKEKLPLTEEAAKKVTADRKKIEDILKHKSHKHLMIVGPCSIHNLEAAEEYAKRLKTLSEKVEDQIMIVMRVYFEKPRTTVGWKGLIYDPDLDSSYHIDKGILIARQLMSDIVNMGLPIATEFLEPFIPQYISDLVSWAAIGARTTESQTHRQMTSGLSMPTGFKNATNGNINIAVEAINTAAHKHAFLGVGSDGKTSIFRTHGNKHCHIVLRGGGNKPNFLPEHIAYTESLMKRSKITPNIIVDCSHENSAKTPERQCVVLRSIIKQILDGNTSIVGSMIESNLAHGRQNVTDPKNVDPNLSITDSCIGWEETESIVMETYENLKNRS